MAEYHEIKRFAAERFPEHAKPVTFYLMRRLYGWGGVTVAKELGGTPATATRLIAKGEALVAEAVASGALRPEDVRAILEPSGRAH